MSTPGFLFMCFDYNDKKTGIGNYSAAELCACKMTELSNDLHFG